MRKKFLISCLLIILLLAGCSKQKSAFDDTFLIDDFSALNGKTYAAVTGSVFPSVINKLPGVEDINILYFDSETDAYNAVKNNKADFSTGEYPTAYYLESHNEGMKIFSGSVLDENIAYITPKNSVLLEDFNRAIKKLKADGTIDRINEKWLNMDENTKIIDQDWEGKNGTLVYWGFAATPPVSFLGDNGMVIGSDPEIALYVARELDYNLEIVPTSFTSVLTGVASGKADLGGGLITVTEERAKTVGFTEPTLQTSVVLLARDLSSGKSSLTENIVSGFKKTFLEQNGWKMILKGCLITVVISVLSVIFGTVLGFGIYMVTRKGNKVLNKIIGVYQWLINGMPVVVILMVFFYIVFGKTTLSGMWISTMVFTLVFASSVIGMLTTGVGAVDIGQTEGGLALGYTPLQTFFKIVFPQAARIFMPSYTNEIVQLVKATAIVGYIAVQDLTRVSDLIRSRTFEPFFPLISSAVLYFIIAWILTLGFKRITKLISPKEDRTQRAVYLKGVKR